MNITKTELTRRRQLFHSCIKQCLPFRTFHSHILSSLFKYKYYIILKLQRLYGLIYTHKIKIEINWNFLDLLFPASVSECSYYFPLTRIFFHKVAMCWIFQTLTNEKWQTNKLKWSSLFVISGISFNLIEACAYYSYYTT